MGHIEPAAGNQPGPPKPWWVTLLKVIGIMAGVVVVLAIVLVGFIFFTCTRH
jgi:hypothetical protein